MKKIIIITFFSMIVLSCSKKVHQEQFTMLSLQGESREDGVDKPFHPVKITSLKEKDDFYIRDVKKVETFNNEYYVLCNNSENVLAVFNESGEEIREIGCWGNGHGEHGQINDFCIDKKNGRVLILCPNSIVIEYTLQGEYITKNKISNSVFWNIASIDGNILCTTNHRTFTEGDDAYLFYLFDENFNLLRKHTPVLPQHMGMFSLITMPLKTINGQYMYSDFYTHRVYMLDKAGIIQKTYEYDINDLMPYRYFSDYDLFSEHQMEYNFILDNIAMNGMIFSIYKSGEQVRVALNQTDGENIKDIIVDGVIPKFYSVDNNYIISVCTKENVERLGLKMQEDINDVYYYIVRYNVTNH